MNALTSGLGPTAVGSLAMKVCQIGIGLLTVFGLSALLGPEEFGTYSFAFAWVQILQIVALAGFQQFLIREVAKAWGKMNLGRLYGLLSVGFGIPMTLAGALAVLGVIQASWGVFPWLTTLLGDPGPVLMAVLPFTLTLLLASVLQGTGQVILSEVPAVIIRPVVFLLLVAVIYYAPGLTLNAQWVLDAQIIGACIAALIAAKWVRPVWKRLDKQRAAPGKIQWKISASIFFLISIITVVLGRIDTLMLGWLGSAADVGVYSLASRAAEQVQLPLVAARMALTPRVAHAAELDCLREIRPVLALYTRIAFILAMGLVCVYALCGTRLLGILDPEYVKGFPALVLLAFMKALGVGIGMVLMLLNMAGRERISLFAMVFALILNITLNLICIPRWGVLGCAAATSVSLLVMQVSLCTITSLQLGIGPLGIVWAGNKN